MSIDLSTAPEIARVGGPAPEPPTAVAGRAPATIGAAAAYLTRLAGQPELWRDQITFDPDRPVFAELPGPCATWLVVTPPGCHDCAVPGGQDESVVTVLAGDMVEHVATEAGLATRPLPRGRVRFHGAGPLRLFANAGAGYAVSLHTRWPRVAS